MKTKFYVLLIIAVAISISSPAQKISYRSGSNFPITMNDRIELLGSGWGHVYYLIQHRTFNAQQEWKSRLLKIDTATMSVAESLDLFNSGYKGDIGMHKLIGNHLYIIFRTGTYSGEKAISYSVEAIRIDLAATMDEYLSKDMGTFDEWPGINHWSDKMLFEASQGTTRKYIDYALKDGQMEKIPSGGGAGINIMPFYDVLMPFEKAKGTKTQSYFFPLMMGTEIWVESQFMSDPKSYGRRKGYYTSIELSEYYPKTESKTRLMKIILKPGVMVLDFECHLLRDSSILIFGIYQEGGMNAKKARFGTFSVLTDKKLSGPPEARFQQVLECDQATLEEHKDFSMLFWDDQTVKFKPAAVYSPESVFMTYIRRPDYNHKLLGLARVNKKNGVTSFDYLQSGAVTFSEWEDMAGFYPLVLSDSISVYFFNDHRKNTGMAANDEKLSFTAELKVKDALLSYAVYSSNTGFRSRNMLLPVAVDKFIPDVEEDDICYLGRNNKGELEFMIIAYDNKKENARFYRITVVE
jgi:hypothetical protein